MLDISLLRKDLSAVAQALAQRKFQLDTALFQQLESERKRLQTETEGLQNQRNTMSRDIGIAKAKGANVDALMAAVATANQSLKSNEAALGALQQQLNDWLLKLPNLAADDVPIGPDESANQEVRRHGAVPSFAFPVRDHVDLGAALGMDFESAALLSGARFVVLKGGIARLHRALSQLMLDHHIANGYTECYVPYIVNQASLTGTGQLPKFADDLFSLNVQGDGDDPRQWFLIPTSEVPLTNLVRDSIVNPALLPFKFAAHTPCFRAEAGSHGRDTRGMVRQHQFDKVEMVQITRASESEQAQQAMVSSAEAILQKLELPYRVIVLCSGDMGFAARKTYDLEVWLPAQNCYREISSISNCGDFQARRMQARTKVEGKMEFLHTLNGSGLAVGRSLVAVLENHQEADGRIRIPRALQPYMGGMEYLSPA